MVNGKAHVIFIMMIIINVIFIMMINCYFFMMIKVNEWYVASQTQIAGEGQLIRAVMFLKPFAVAQENALLRT